MTTDALLNRITIDHNLLVGKPVVRGTRISVELVIDLLARGASKDRLIEQYDNLTTDDVHACLAYAREVLQSRRRRKRTAATLALCIAVVAFAVGLRWWSCASSSFGQGLHVPSPHSGAKASVMSSHEELFFGGHENYVELRITSSANEVIATARVDLPSTGYGLDLRSDGKIVWVEDDRVVVTCPSKDFAGGEFRLEIPVPKNSAE